MRGQSFGVGVIALINQKSANIRRMEGLSALHGLGVRLRNDCVDPREASGVIPSLDFAAVLHVRRDDGAELVLSDLEYRESFMLTNLVEDLFPASSPCPEIGRSRTRRRWQAPGVLALRFGVL
jgi:hypothetical protein